MVVARAIYSASQVDSATVGCFFVFHEIKAPHSVKLTQ